MRGPIPRFTALDEGTFSPVLAVDDGNIESEPDTVIVRATEINLPPIAGAGPGQEIEVGFLVQLDGSNSSDPEDAPLTYSWIQVADPRWSFPILQSQDRFFWSMKSKSTRSIP